jgi:hypothetical protein
MCFPSSRKVAASYSVIVRASDSHVPHITPATSTYNIMLTKWATLTSIGLLDSPTLTIGVRNHDIIESFIE